MRASMCVCVPVHYVIMFIMVTGAWEIIISGHLTEEEVPLPSNY